MAVKPACLTIGGILASIHEYRKNETEKVKSGVN